MPRKLFLFAIFLFITNLTLAGYYYLYLPFSYREKTDEESLATAKIKNLLTFPKFISFVADHPNMEFINGALVIDNSSDNSNNQYFSFVHRPDLLSVSDTWEVTIKFEKISGEVVAVRLIDKFSDKQNDWWTVKSGIELMILDKENNLYLHVFDSQKGVDKIHPIGLLPDDNLITLRAEKERIIFYDSANEWLKEIPLTKPLIGRNFTFGFLAGPGAQLKVSQFFIDFSPPMRPEHRIPVEKQLLSFLPILR